VNGQHNHIPHPRESSARTNVLYGTYFKIAETEFCSCLELLTIDQSSLDDNDIYELENKAKAFALKAIVFAAMSIESAINNYAGKHLGDKYYQQHLASLDLVSKWIIIPRLVCERSLDKSGAAYNALKILVSARNKLVHNKSEELNGSDPYAVIKKQDKRSEEFKLDFHSSLKALYLLSMEMDFVVGHIQNPLGTLDSTFNPSLAVPELAKELFKNCKDTVLKKYS
jgi:hypothetical protein